MPRCKRERFSGSLPLAFLSMPMGGALTVGMTLTALRQSALTATSLRNSPGAMAPRMLLRPRRLCNRGREEDCGYSVGNRFTLRLRRAQAGRRNGRGQEDGVAMQAWWYPVVWYDMTQVHLYTSGTHPCTYTDVPVPPFRDVQCSMFAAKPTACSMYKYGLLFVLSHALFTAYGWLS